MRDRNCLKGSISIMGDKQSKHSGHHESRNQSPETSKTTATTTAAPPPPPVEKVDVLITSTNADADLALANLIKVGLEEVSLSVHIHSDVTDEAAKIAAKLVVDAKCLVYVASKEAAKNNVGQDLISLAFISNKPILVAAEIPKLELMKDFIVGMKMTLHMLHWKIFDVDPKSQIEDYVKEIQQQVSVTANPTSSVDASALMARRGGRLNTKLRQQTTVQDFGENQPQIGSFWDRNFSSEEEVAWYKFQKCFLDDYEAQLSKLLDDENIPWLLEMLKNDIFEGAERVTKEQFMQVRGESKERNAFWRVVSQIAVEKYNMKEVFNMTSSVRLTAIEKLAKFQNPAVVEALLKLLDDLDPNVRAVAAISLGRTGCSEERVVDSLISLLKDSDRIVRQSACLSLGAMKAVKAIPHIGNIWRNDFISVVRSAARTALENMKIPEAQEVLSVTKVLEDEIAALEGNQAAV